MATDDEALDSRLAAAISTLRDTPPATDLWSGIVPKLTPRTTPGTVRLRWPTALAAGLVIALGSAAGTVAYLRRPTPPAPVPAAVASQGGLVIVSATATPVDATLESAIGQVESLLESLRDQLDPDARAALARSLARLDEAIVHAAEQRRTAPNDAQAAQLLTATLRRKLDLLRSNAVLASKRS